MGLAIADDSASVPLVRITPAPIIALLILGLALVLGQSPSASIAPLATLHISTPYAVFAEPGLSISRPPRVLASIERGPAMRRANTVAARAAATTAAKQIAETVTAGPKPRPAIVADIENPEVPDPATSLGTISYPRILEQRFTKPRVKFHASVFTGVQWAFQGKAELIRSSPLSGTNTAWVSYDLWHGNGRAFLGKIEDAAPAPHNQWFERSGFGAIGMSSGEHTWDPGDNRWGTKVVYSSAALSAQVAYLGSAGDLNVDAEFSSKTDRSFDWQLAYAPVDAPYEIGVFGTLGTLPTSDGKFDRYRGTSVYAQFDPTAHLPGMSLVYESGHDNHSGPGSALQQQERRPSTYTSLSSKSGR